MFLLTRANVTFKIYFELSSELFFSYLLTVVDSMKLALEKLKMDIPKVDKEEGEVTDKKTEDEKLNTKEKSKPEPDAPKDADTAEGNIKQVTTNPYSNTISRLKEW